MGPDAMIFVFWKLSFKPPFSLSTFTFIKRLFSSSSISAIRVVSSAYLRLLIFLPARTVLPIKSSSALSPPPLQKNLNLKPLKGPLNPQPLISTWQMDLLPTTPEVKLPKTRHHPLALPPPNWETMTPKPQKRLPLPRSINQDPKQTQIFSQRGRDQRGLHGSVCLSQFLMWAKLNKNWGLFQKTLLDIGRNSSIPHKHII